MTFWKTSKKAQIYFVKAYDKLTERTVSDNALLQINIANWGAFATEDELKNAIAAQKDSHGTFDQLEAMAEAIPPHL